MKRQFKLVIAEQLVHSAAILSLPHTATSHTPQYNWPKCRFRPDFGPSLFFRTAFQHPSKNGNLPFPLHIHLHMPRFLDSRSNSNATFFQSYSTFLAICTILLRLKYTRRGVFLDETKIFTRNYTRRPFSGLLYSTVPVQHSSNTIYYLR